MTTATEVERYSQILHKTHGWLEAPEHCWFQLSPTGKSVELHEPEWMWEMWGPGTGRWYPYGTRWHTSSIVAFAGDGPA